MKGSEINKLAVFVVNINFRQIADVYGYIHPTKFLMDSKQSYLNAKLGKARQNPLLWLCSLDSVNLDNLAFIISRNGE